MLKQSRHFETWDAQVILVFFSLHLFTLQAIYIVLQDWKIKDAI